VRVTKQPPESGPASTLFSCARLDNEASESDDMKDSNRRGKARLQIQPQQVESYEVRLDGVGMAEHGTAY
jgi:hypothetical protein